MVDNTSAFHSSEYDRKIRQTFPYYEDFFAQVVELVRTVHAGPVCWLDVGCGTGMMGSAAFGNIPLERFVFMDSSEGMIGRAKERFRFPNAEFSVRDVRDLQYENEFDVITAIQVFHFLQAEERRTVLRQCHAALKENGILVSFENIAPFTETGKTVCLEKWRRFQMEQGKSREETEGHISRYGKDYFPITIEEHLRLLRESGFRVVEMLWFSNTQAGFWAMK